MIEQDDFLRKLIQQSPLESPSDDFVDRVMDNITVAPELVPVRKSFLSYANTAIPYAILSLVLVTVFTTSDFPFLNWLPGREYFQNSILPYFGSLFTSLKIVFTSKYVTFGILISISAGVLFLIDNWFTKRSTV